MEITRQVLLDADRDEVWEALVDDEIRSEWLDDARPLEILTADAGRTLTWRWTQPDGHGVESTVTVEIEQADDGRTRLTVTETAAAPACSVGAPTIDVDVWDRRLLGLELRCALRSAAPVLV